MTIAICIRCGETKFGAWTRCEACGFEPASTTDLAKSLVATDHYFSVDYLHRAAEGLKRGRPLVFSGEQIAECAAQIEAQMYFLDNFDFDAGTIKCVKCGRVFSPDIDTEEVECPDCLRRMPGGSGPSVRKKGSRRASVRTADYFRLISPVAYATNLFLINWPTLMT